MDQTLRCIDTHCHLDLIESQGGSIEEVLVAAKARGVGTVVQIATDLAGSKRNRELAASFAGRSDVPNLRWTGGLHPENAHLDETEGILDFLRANNGDPHFLGVGETGLDYYHDPASAPRQKEHFGRHLDIAAELNRPIVVHLRDDRVFVPGRSQTFVDALELVKNRPSVKGVLHCYTYGPEEAKPFLDRGWFVSFSGIVTYKTAQAIQEAAVRFPLDSILVETDAPYLAPIPYRGQKNSPAFVVDTLDFVTKLRAERLGEDRRMIETAILRNSFRFLGLEPQGQ